MDIFINKKLWETFSTEEMNEYKEQVFKHYRSNGFPYYSTDDISRQKEFQKLVKYDFHKVIDAENKIIKQSMHGLNLAWSYMPHSFNVQCNGLKTAYDVFNDDILFRKAIDKRIAYGDNMSDSGIRKVLKIFTGTQCVSNFRPTAAAALYSVFCERGGVVWDISSGYGGRLLGAYLAGVTYIGTEPCTETYKGLVNMNNDFGLGGTIYHCGSEDYNVTPNSLDFVFTSPPYFNTEKYSTEDTQSYVKYPTKQLWVDGYLTRTFKNAFIGLKSGCYMAINISNVKSFPTLEQETISTAIKCGFEYVDLWKLSLSSINGAGFKYEPIFIFYKK